MTGTRTEGGGRRRSNYSSSKGKRTGPKVGRRCRRVVICQNKSDRLARRPSTCASKLIVPKGLVLVWTILVLARCYFQKKKQLVKVIVLVLVRHLLALVRPVLHLSFTHLRSKCKIKIRKEMFDDKNKIRKEVLIDFKNKKRTTTKVIVRSYLCWPTRLMVKWSP